MYLSDVHRPSYGHIRRLPLKGTSCPSGTICLDKSVVIRHECHRLQLFRDDNFNSAFSPQYVDTDILRMTIKREVDRGVSDPEILNLNVLQVWRQDRLRE